MYFAALTAISSILALSVMKAHTAPVNVRALNNAIPQFCTAVNGTGNCTPLDGEECTNTPGMASLILNPDNDCAAFPLPDCAIGTGAFEMTADISFDLTSQGFQSVQCFTREGTIDGITEGSPEDIANEAFDASKGINDQIPS
ncbi:hypothetical protein FB45DRAFT_1009164 [Roridomyces roridus]|uniref:Uncharacterized protein n=1 Tax=Roridomyces roridus TaxID=1738132 RepID=A0AAD7B8R8_9AGAR|nr:hypothetical protein FB45DRAFT_1009164 [Roridomyces roridus]